MSRYLSILLLFLLPFWGGRDQLTTIDSTIVYSGGQEAIRGNKGRAADEKADFWEENNSEYQQNSIALSPPLYLEDPDKRDLLFWNEKRNLDWKDFRGNPDSFSNYAASTFWGISFDTFWKENRGTFVVYTTFNKQKSWAKREPRSERLLNHEQLHYDIAEMYARMLRKAFSEHSFSQRSFRREVDQLFQLYWDACVEVQDRYDHETDHGLNPVIQETYEDWVFEKLESLNEWAR